MLIVETMNIYNSSYASYTRNCSSRLTNFALTNISNKLNVQATAYHTLQNIAFERGHHSFVVRNISSQLAEAKAAAADSLEPAMTLEEVAQQAAVWAALNGLVVALPLDQGNAAGVMHAPLSLAPVPYPAAQFQLAQQVMPLLNCLTDDIARDEAFLVETLTAAAQYDDFTARLLQCLQSTAAARQRRAATQVALAINRSDYMLDEPSGKLLQVEMNTIASSFGSLSTKVSALHRHLLSLQHASAAQDAGHLPDNHALAGIAAAMAAAVAARREAQHAAATGEALVVFVVQPGERNVYDQQWLQQELWSVHGIRTIRKTLEELAQQGRLDSHENLLVQGKLVDLVYFRSGYAPTDYPSLACWEARELIESSTAVRCPDVAYQLAGAKKVQQVLAQPGVVERYCNKDESQLIRRFFAGLWALDDISQPDTQAVMQDAVSHPDKYVLKPQREGGGNNLYGAEMVTALQQGGKGLAAYIMMQRIQPPVNRSSMLRMGQVVECDSLSELGVYGVLVRKGNELVLNEQVGHLVRTKPANSNEGGVAAGFAVLDSPLLV